MLRRRQQGRVGWWLIGNWCRTVTIARRREARCHELAEQRGSVRAITCRRGAAGVVAVHCGDCDGLAIGNCDGLVIDKELIEVCLEVGDCQGVGQTRHRDHAVVVGDRDRLAVGRVDENFVHATIAAAGQPTPKVDGDLLHVGSGLIVDRDVVGPTPKVDGDLLHAGSGQIVDRDVVGELALVSSLELDALDTGEIDGAAGTQERRPPEPLPEMVMVSPPFLPRKSSVSKPRPPSTMSLPSPGFQMNVSLPLPRNAVSLPLPPITVSSPLPPKSISLPP